MGQQSLVIVETLNFYNGIPKQKFFTWAAEIFNKLKLQTMNQSLHYIINIPLFLDKKLAEVQKENDIEDSQPKLRYPRSIPFIVVNEFCERFNFYGMKAILVLYLTRKLLYDANDGNLSLSQLSVKSSNR